MAARLAARGLPSLADHARADLGQCRSPQDRLPGALLLLRAEEHRRAKEPRRCRSRAARLLRQARHPAHGAEAARRRQGIACRGRRRVRFGVGGHDLQGGAGQGRRDLLLGLRGSEDPSRAGAQISRFRGAHHRQFLRHAQFGGVLRRQLRLCAAGRALPHGVVDLFPHQRGADRPVRAHPDHRRQGLLRELSRRLHRAHARREPAPCRRGRACRARRRRDQILDGAELVSRRQGRQGRHLQFRHQARRLPGQERAHLLDAGRDRLRHHLEVSLLHPARRRLTRRVLLDRHLQRLSAGRFRHQDDPSRQGHVEPHHLQGHRRRPFQQHLSRAGLGASQGRQCAELHLLRLAAHW